MILLSSDTVRRSEIEISAFRVWEVGSIRHQRFKEFEIWDVGNLILMSSGTVGRSEIRVRRLCWEVGGVHFESEFDTHRQTDTQTGTHRQTYTQTGTTTDTHTDIQTDRHRDRHTDRHTDRHRDMHCRVFRMSVWPSEYVSSLIIRTRSLQLACSAFMFQAHSLKESHTHTKLFRSIQIALVCCTRVSVVSALSSSTPSACTVLMRIFKEAFSGPALL